MLADQPMLRAVVTAVLVHILIGSLVWMFAYSRGRLARVYGTELTGSGEVLDFIGNLLITLVLIAGWPIALIGIRKGRLQ
ncbi:hypothetical protein [Bradyrhizobium sp. SEMIA]|uniref:hypothetical protein n=1 Tax=Bradyrhizobium sp. SEMIA TaxID=2597515 RepID=UPI0018A50ADF|nr:hypothetical protein [Bradyrhizobium sp. SEMIA]QOG20416.1 hypothetical protein FOM02_26770 [Bradyrhizobium sp. SEMIA]